jgi:hypothetical protein
MVFLLVLAVALFIIGAFTVKLLWLAALVLAAFWLFGTLRSSHRIHA